MILKAPHLLLPSFNTIFHHVIPHYNLKSAIVFVHFLPPLDSYTNVAVLPPNATHHVAAHETVCIKSFNQRDGNCITAFIE